MDEKLPPRVIGAMTRVIHYSDTVLRLYPNNGSQPQEPERERKSRRDCGNLGDTAINPLSMKILHAF
jgi:hypothetical protein